MREGHDKVATNPSLLAGRRRVRAAIGARWDWLGVPVRGAAFAVRLLFAHRRGPTAPTLADVAAALSGALFIALIRRCVRGAMARARAFDGCVRDVSAGRASCRCDAMRSGPAACRRFALRCIRWRTSDARSNHRRLDTDTDADTDTDTDGVAHHARAAHSPPAPYRRFPRTVNAADTSPISALSQSTSVGRSGAGCRS